MKPQDYAKLEGDYSFKRSYLSKTPWWKTILIIAPICLLFVGLAGIIYILKQDMLASLYSIPYLALFVVGTIWFKAIKRHIFKTKINTPDSFLVCLARPIHEEVNKVFSVFITDSHRHNSYYIKNLGEKIEFEELIKKDSNLQKKGVHPIYDDNSESNLFLFVSDAKDISKKNKSWNKEETFPVLYIDKDYTFAIKAKDLTFYTK
ncbi:hypothetical protein [Dysgonomonas sp. Marseille-P4361]|uniref:hypothetical protein n=1 Tax=Dysgonomonas sp. Marseille-P4361 TaxID=2161820 RepID=UPI000D54E9DC|nr:hypothetical protein [Dysgonomonas sp. Marseille-P4361]